MRVLACAGDRRITYRSWFPLSIICILRIEFQLPGLTASLPTEQGPLQDLHRKTSTYTSLVEGFWLE